MESEVDRSGGKSGGEEGREEGGGEEGRGRGGEGVVVEREETGACAG